MQPGTVRRGTGQHMKVIGLGIGEPQRTGDPGEHFARGTWRPALLEPDVVLGRDVCEDRDLLAAQTRRPASWARGQTDVLRLDPLAAAAEECPKLLLVHISSMRASRRLILVPLVPVSGLKLRLTLAS